MSIWPTDSYYRRRHHRDGHSYIVHSSGPALIRRADYGLVIDYYFAPSREQRPVSGRQGKHHRTIEPASNPASAARLWVWEDRPLRIVQFFDPSGRTIVYRIDLATPPLRTPQAFYQTDLYLDVFLGADGSSYIIQDEDELEIAFAAGLISDVLRSQALTWTERIVDLLDRGRFLDWLATACPTRFTIEMLPGVRAWTSREWKAGEADGWPEEAT